MKPAIDTAVQTLSKGFFQLLIMSQSDREVVDFQIAIKM